MIKLGRRGSQRLAAVTRELSARRPLGSIAIVHAGFVESEPRVSAAIESGVVSFTVDARDAEGVAARLRPSRVP